jgi:hypothetical protein
VARIAQGTTESLALTRRNLTQVSPPVVPVPLPPAIVPSEVDFLHQFNSTPDGELFTAISLAADAQGSGVTLRLKEDPLTQFRADAAHTVSIIGLAVPGGNALPLPTKSARISSADPAPQEYIELRPIATLAEFSVGFSLRIGPAFTPQLFITTDTVQILAAGEFVVCQLACHPAYGIWVHTQAGAGELVPIVPEEWYWVAMLYDGPTAVGKMRVYRIRDWQYLGESVLPVMEFPVYGTLYGRTDAVHVATNDYFWYGVFCGRYNNSFPIVPGEAFVAPVPLSASIDSIGRLVVTYSRACEFGTDGSVGLTLAPAGAAVTLTLLDGGGTAIHRYAVSRTIPPSESATLDYMSPGPEGIRTHFLTPLPSFAGLAITHDPTPIGYSLNALSATGGGLNVVSGRTIPITIGQTANGLATYGCAFFDPNTNAIAVTFDGVAMPQVAYKQNPGGNSQAKLFGLAIGNKAAGTYNVVVTWAGGQLEYFSDGAAVHNGVYQATPFNLAGASGAALNSTAVSVAIASDVGKKVFGVFYADEASAITMGSGQTERHNRTLDGIGFAFSEQDGAAAPADTTHGYSNLATSIKVVAAVSVNLA